MMDSDDKNLRFNLTVNILDGSFFGLGLGFSSFVTVLPLFVSQMTDSAILIGLIPAIHAMGWQLLQLFTVDHVTRLSRYKPMVLLMTVHERLPFLALAVVAWFLPGLDRGFALVLTYACLVWQGLGGGFTGTAWQSMIGKIMPPRGIGMFYGMQSAAGNLLASGGAIAAGFILERISPPGNYALCFLLTAIAMAISWFFLSRTREPARPPTVSASASQTFLSRMGAILRRDVNFRWFLIARMLSQVSVMSFGFYTVYAVRHHGMDVFTAGVMTAVLTGAQIAANPIMGWMGDRWGYRRSMQFGALAAAASTLLAWFSPGIEWFYPAFLLAGVASVATWTIALAMTLEFNAGSERPAYIGLANSLVAPSTILAPLVGGWLADTAGYPAMFLVGVVGGLATVLVLFAVLRDPPRVHEQPPVAIPAE